MSADAECLDLLSIGAWAVFDHFARVAEIPREGRTVRITSPLDVALEPRFGDCSCNVAAVAAALGTRTGLATVVGDDFEASGYAAHLRALGVDLDAVEVRPAVGSGHNWLYADAAGNGFCVSHLGVAADQTAWRAPTPSIERCRALVVSEMFSPYTLDAIVRARALGRLTAINGMIATAGELTRPFLRHADLLFIAAAELRDLLDQLDLTRTEQLLDLGPSRLFVTQGVHGSETIAAGERVAVPLVPAERVVDATGAGDAYAAGTLSALIRGLAPPEAARVGAATASFVVEAWGAQGRLPSWREVASRRDAQPSLREIP